MTKIDNVVQAIEINADLIGALFTDRDDNQLRVFCFYVNGDTAQFEVPEEPNRDSLHSLFAKLNMVDQCTNVVLEKIVRGRIYVEREGGLFSYTLLAALGDVHSLLDADICNLPWKTVWTSPEAEVLRVAGSSQTDHCYAIRSPVRDVDVAALYRTARAFVRPKTVVKTSTRGIHNNATRQGVIAALLVMAVALGWLLGYSMGNKTPAARFRASIAAAAASTIQKKAHLLSAQTVTGPYTMAELAGMSAEGKLPADAMFRIVGSPEWLPWHELPPGAATAQETR